MAGGVRIIDRDNGYKRLIVNVRKMGNTTVSVGVNDTPHPGSPDLTNAQVGAFHEFGLGNNPPRSFLRAWADQDQKNWMSKLKWGVYKALFGTGRWADDFGAYCVRQVQARMRRGIPPKLAPETLARKERRGQPETPLIASGQLIDAVEYEVRK